VNRGGCDIEGFRLTPSLSSRPDTREGGWESRDLLVAVRAEEIPDESPRIKAGGLSGMTMSGNYA
jgi:hypothetical protein